MHSRPGIPVYTDDGHLPLAGHTLALISSPTQATPGSRKSNRTVTYTHALRLLFLLKPLSHLILPRPAPWMPELGLRLGQGQEQETAHPRVFPLHLPSPARVPCSRVSLTQEQEAERQGCWKSLPVPTQEKGRGRGLGTVHTIAQIGDWIATASFVLLSFTQH